LRTRSGSGGTEVGGLPPPGTCRSPSVVTGTSLPAYGQVMRTRRGRAAGGGRARGRGARTRGADEGRGRGARRESAQPDELHGLVRQEPGGGPVAVAQLRHHPL